MPFYSSLVCLAFQWSWIFLSLLYPGAGDNATGVRDLQRRTNGVMEATAMSNSTLSVRSYAQPHRALVFERQTPCCGTRNGCGEVTYFKVHPKKASKILWNSSIPPHARSGSRNCSFFWSCNEQGRNRRQFEQGSLAWDQFGRSAAKRGLQKCLIILSDAPWPRTSILSNQLAVTKALNMYN